LLDERKAKNVSIDFKEHYWQPTRFFTFIIATPPGGTETIPIKHCPSASSPRGYTLCRGTETGGFLMVGWGAVVVSF